LQWYGMVLYALIMVCIALPLYGMHWKWYGMVCIGNGLHWQCKWYAFPCYSLVCYALEMVWHALEMVWYGVHWNW
jgi:hypothetical protein